MRLRCVCTATVLAFLGCVSTADAKARPRVSLTIPEEISTGNSFTGQWRSSHVPRGARLYIQKPVGTGSVWKSVTHALTGTAGSATVPAYSSLGVYRLRIAVIQRGKVLASQEQRPKVFATVPLSSLLGNLPVSTVSVPAAAFPYVLRGSVSVSMDGEGSHAGVISDSHSSCDVVRLEFVAQAFEPLSPAEQKLGTASASIVQQSAEPAAVSAPVEDVGAVETHVALRQSWAVNIKLSDFGSDIVYGIVFVNGSAHCDSTEKLNYG